MNFKSMAAQAQRLQKELESKQEEFFKKEFEVDYKNGSIVITIMGDRSIKSIKINPTLIDPEDPIMLEEMVAEAVNNAYTLVKEQLDEITNSIMPAGAGGLGGLF